VRIIKLGGSLGRGPLLRPWLRAAAATPGAVIVPGGGGFADCVRQAQTHWGFSDQAAHAMALLAMDQFGIMLTALAPGLDPAADPQAIRASHARGRVPVWLPHAMLGMGHPDIRASWDVTSDSLALWLAVQLAAQQLLLIKSAQPSGNPASDQRLLDAAFADLQAAHGMPVHLLGPADLPPAGCGLQVLPACNKNSGTGS